MKKVFFILFAISMASVAMAQVVYSDTIWVGDTLKEEELLEDVVISVKRPLLERKMDKIVVNVSQSTFAVGHNGEDILRKSPGVNIDKDGNVTVNGKSVEIYIDGRKSYMSGDQLKGLLMGTDASTIEKIEIITNPSSKYEAAGQGGIIDIKLKKNKSKGLNGTIAGNYAGMYWRDLKKYMQDDMVSLGLNYRGEKTYTALSLTQVYANQNWDMDVNSEQPRTINNVTKQQHLNTHSNNDITFQYYDLRLSNDFYIDSANTLGFILNVPIMKFDMNASNERNYSTLLWGTDTLQRVNTNGSKVNYSPQHSANLNYTHVFCDSLSRELTANIDYNRFTTKNRDNQQNNILWNLEPTTPPDELNINTKQTVDIYSAKMDFQTAFWQTGMLEAGAKWVMSNTFNSMTTDSVVAAQTSSHETRYDYSEQVGAVYISAAKQFNQHWNAKLGLRGELTYAKGTFHQANADSVVSQKPYFNLFPSAFVGYSPTNDWNMNISYTRRIKRAKYYQLNPFISYYDAHTYECGNPNLQPEFNHQVDLNFSYSRFVSLGFNFSHTQAMQNQRILIDEKTGDLMRTWVNFGTCTTHGGFLSLTELPLVPKFKKDNAGAYVRNEKGRRTFDEAWLTLTTNLNAYYFINKADSDATYGTQKSYWWSIYACLTAYLPKDFQIALDGNFNAPCINGYTEWGGYYTMDLAIKKQFLQKTLTLTLKVDDLLCSTNWYMRQVGMAEGYSSRVDQRANRHKVGIGLTYMFGQAEGHKQRKVGGVDEASRLGNGGNIGSR